MFKLNLRKKILLCLAALCAVFFILCGAFLLQTNGTANADSGTGSTLSDDFSEPPTRVEKPRFNLDRIEYDAKEHTVYDFGLIGFDERIMTISVDRILEARDYEVTIAFKSGINYCWTGEGTDTSPQTHTLTIISRVIHKPTGELKIAYNGLVQTFTHERLEEDWVTVTGNTATAIGSYTATASLVDKDNTQWDDGTVEDKQIVWEITRGVLKAPEAKDDIHYIGKDIDITQNLVGFNSAFMDISGEVTGKDAGTYEVTVKLKDSVNYGWEDESGDVITLQWEIKKAKLSPVWIKNGFTPFITVPADFTNLVDFDYAYYNLQGGEVAQSALVNDTDYTVVAKIKTEYTKNFEFAAANGEASAESEPCAFKAIVTGADEGETPPAPVEEEKKMEQWQFWILLGLLAANILMIFAFAMVVIMVMSKKGTAQQPAQKSEPQPVEESEQPVEEEKPEIKTLSDAVEALSEEQKNYFNGLRAYALSKPDAVEVEQNNYQWVVCDNKPIIALGVRDGITVAVLQNVTEKGQHKNTVISVEDKDSFKSAMDMIDTRAEQIKNN